MQDPQDTSPFPPTKNAADDGLLAIGGNLSPELLIHAYSKGIFPWYNEGEPIQWYSPDPRCVLFPAELKVSKSLKQTIRSGKFRFSVNEAFPAVIANCATVPRSEQDGTWISSDMIKAYTKLHELGFVYSAETWSGSMLVGGLYGVLLGNIFFGESMFATKNDASKFAFANFCALLLAKNVEVIDCQVATAHLFSLGARMIPRSEFEELLPQTIVVTK